MKVDVTQVLYDVWGKEIKTSERFCPTCRQTVGKVQSLTIRAAMINALEAKGPNENVTFNEQMDRYYLSVDIAENDEVDLEATEIIMLQDLLSDVYGPAVTGPIGVILKDGVPPEQPSRARKRGRRGGRVRAKAPSGDGREPVPDGAA